MGRGNRVAQYSFLQLGHSQLVPIASKTSQATWPDSLSRVVDNLAQSLSSGFELEEF